MQEREFIFYRNRLNIFCQRVKEDIYTERLQMSGKVTVSDQWIGFKERLDREYHPVNPGEKWGDAWQSGWFNFTAVIPEEFADKEIMFLCNTGGEALIYSESGVPVYALTGGTVFNDAYSKNNCLLPCRAEAGKEISFWVESAANLLYGLVFDQQRILRTKHPAGRFTGILNCAELAVFDREVWNLSNDLDVLLSMIDGLPADDFRKRRYTMIVNRAADVYNENPANATSASKVLQEIFSVSPSEAMLKVCALGHAHIDTGWLWPVKESIRKVGRTFASQLALIETYPEYIFSASAAQHYLWAKEYYPEIYGKIKSAIAAGRWEITGGMWVESDVNITGGESLIRQFLTGKNFFMDEFGVDVKNLWIPDCFGYSASLPQIALKSGCDTFLTQKISWNQFNEFPYNTFLWQGIDNSRLLTHFPPENTYNALVNPHELIAAQNRFKEADILDEFVSLFGIGDGGGGPYPELIEKGRRCANLDGVPRLRFDRVENFFSRLKQKSASLPVYSGELYLEKHVGTLTSQARIKKSNRQAEARLIETEYLASLLPLTEYPSETLDLLWKKLLINQFHDILPGSSIRKVYETTEEDHRFIFEKCEELITAAAQKVFEHDEKCMTVINTLSYPVKTLISVPEKWNGYSLLDKNGTSLPLQRENNTYKVLLELQGTSINNIFRGDAVELDDSCCNSSDLILENDLIRYRFTRDGQLTEAFDKISNRSLLTGNMCGNRLALYVDLPQNYDAWDIDRTYLNQNPEHPTAVNAAKIIDGKLRSVIEFELQLSKSVIRQRAVLDSHSAALHFHTRVDWQESHRMLRTSFPVDIPSQSVSCDIQYGFIRRPTHENTPVEQAMYEICAHRYADISCDSFGAALLNNCKYGYRVKNGVIDLALLRSPKYPDHEADMGIQEFTYTFLPHAGNLIHSSVMMEAALLNRPVMILPEFRSGRQFAIGINSPRVTLEVIKKAEKEDCLIIRAVETHGMPAVAELSLNGLTGAVETDLTEWKDLKFYQAVSGKITLEFTPFEIKTLKLKK